MTALHSLYKIRFPTAWFAFFWQFKQCVSPFDVTLWKYFKGLAFPLRIKLATSFSGSLKAKPTGDHDAQVTLFT